MTEIDLSLVRGGMRNPYTCYTALAGGFAGVGEPVAFAQQKLVPSQINSRGNIAARAIAMIAGAAAVYYGTDACK